MSCRQNTSDLVESESPDGPGPFQATGAGAPCTKSALSLSGFPRGILHRPRSPRQHPATNSTSSVCTQKSHDNIINLPQCFNMLIIISNYPTIHLDSAVQCPKPAINRRNIDAGNVFSVL